MIGPDFPDDLQQSIVDFACSFGPAQYGKEDIDRCQLHLLDTFGALVAGRAAKSSAIARAVAPLAFDGVGASLFGAGRRTSPEMAAFANATAARDGELNDVYFSINGAGAHPSDVVMPLFAVAEAEGRSGRDLMEAVLIAYEIYLNFSDHALMKGFDQTLIAGLAVAISSGRLMGLSESEIGEAASLAIVANNPLNQTRRNELTMWKALAAGQAAKAGISAAILARAGAVGPSRPFSGKMGLFHRVASRGEALGKFAPPGARLRIHDVMVKPRAACAATISTILAGEKIAGEFLDYDEIGTVQVATYESAWAVVGSGEERWNPLTGESADHSIPYVVAATLVDGTVGGRQFEPDRLFDETIRGVMAKVSVIPDPVYTELNVQPRPEHHTRVVVTTKSGKVYTGESGGDAGDMQFSARIDVVADKFHRLADPIVGTRSAQMLHDHVLDLSSEKTLYNIASLLAAQH